MFSTSVEILGKEPNQLSLLSMSEARDCSTERRVRARRSFDSPGSADYYWSFLRRRRRELEVCPLIQQKQHEG
jgi:hypothetical protein